MAEAPQLDDAPEFPKRSSASKPKDVTESPRRLAVLDDNGFIYAVGKGLGSPRPNQKVLVDLVESEARRLMPDLDQAPPLVHVWTSAPVVEHEGFRKFVDYLENRLSYKVHPTQRTLTFLADVRGLADEKTIERINARLQRHDALLSYIIGRFAREYPMAVITDSRAVVETLLDAARVRGGRNCIAAFRNLLDKDTLKVVGDDPQLLGFIDLDPHIDAIFRRDSSVIENRRTLPDDL